MSSAVKEGITVGEVREVSTVASSPFDREEEHKVLDQYTLLLWFHTNMYMLKEYLG